jgi:hypothetical protein
MSLRKILMRSSGILVLALPAGPKVLLLMPYVQLPGTKFVILKTTLLKIILRLYSFRGDKALLGHREP